MALIVIALAMCLFGTVGAEPLSLRDVPDENIAGRSTAPSGPR
jgi:hypothetical protein